MEILVETAVVIELVELRPLLAVKEIHRLEVQEDLVSPEENRHLVAEKSEKIDRFQKNH